MSDLLSIGRSAVAAYQQALGTVSNNIANLTNPAYSRQEVALSDGYPKHVGTVYLGTGVMFEGVRRSYDAFAESGLRTSISALGTHEPLIEYANRIVDVMGGGQSGLSPVLDRFFSAARAVSAAPAASDARSAFMRSADDVASRLRDLSGQLDGVESESRQAITQELDDLNTLAAQLARVNAQFRGAFSADSQPAALLDQRDAILRDMSKIARLGAAIRPNGEAGVTLGDSAGQSAIVDGDRVHALGAVFSMTAPGKVDIVMDPGGNAASVPGIDSGSLAGLVAFRQQVLEPARTRLDLLAKTFASQVNDIQGSGVDMQGQLGKPMYAVDPMFVLESPGNDSKVQVEAAVVDPAAMALHDIDLRYDARNALWHATDTVSGQAASGTTELTINGTRLTFAGTAVDADTLKLRALDRPAATIRSVISDPMALAAGAMFRVIENPRNTGGADAQVSYQPTQATRPGPPALERVLVNNLNPSASVAFANPVSAPISAVATIPAGYAGIALALQSPPPASLDLQVMTRDGRHLVGTALGVDQQRALMDPANGFAAGASYSADYLGATGAAGYRKMDVFYGAIAVPARDAAFDAENHLVDTRPPVAGIETGAMPAAAPLPGTTYIAAGALTLNGKPVTSLAVPPGGLRPADIARWLAAQGPAGADVSVTAVNRIRIAAASLNVQANPDPAHAALAVSAGLSINGIEIARPALGFADAESLAAAINAQSADTGVIAEAGRDGGLTLANSAGNEGDDIAIGSPTGSPPGQPALLTDNALGLRPMTLHGQLSITSGKEIRLGVGPGGSAADLAKLGVRATAYVNGTAGEDLLVFATGTGAGAVAATYQTGVLDKLADQRGRPLDIQFTSKDSYTITDAATGSVLANRTYVADTDIAYGGLHLRFSKAPAAGDRFRIDGNQDGVGNNENILRLGSLEQDLKPMPGGKTFSQAYQELVSNIGQVASQAGVAQQAMAAINQQAIEHRARVSGVNLDDEAADLIRYQQAYQAAAKTIQVASQLFDTIVQIR